MNKKVFILFKRFVSGFMTFILIVTSVGPSYAQSVVNGLDLPVAGSRVNVSASFVPPILKGIRVDLKEPFKFDFILDTGNSDLKDDGLKDEAGKLIRYFLASLTIPEKDLWVNLSPYEKDRIIADEFSLTEMGRDLLAQDYILKQITASLIYPESEVGKEFWGKVYAKAYELYGTTEVPTDTFNKVWIVPNKAVVYENGTKAFVVEASLKVMMENDYKTMQESEVRSQKSEKENHLTADLLIVDQSNAQGQNPSQDLSKQILREVVIPVLEREVNEGKNFSKLRQVYYSLILAKWYKDNLKTSILNKKYSDQKKVNGVDLADKGAKEEVYAQYLEALKKGAFNYIKEESDENTDDVLSRKYFSGGCDFAMTLKIEKTSRISDSSVQMTGASVEIVGNFGEAKDIPPFTYRISSKEDVPAESSDFAQIGATGTLEEMRAEQEKDKDLRTLFSRGFRQIVWGLEIWNPFFSAEVLPAQIKNIVTQLRNTDVLGNILKIKDGDWIVVFRRPGTTKDQSGIKDFNGHIGEEWNNRIISETHRELRRLMVQEGLISDSGDQVVMSSYKEDVFRFNQKMSHSELIAKIERVVSGLYEAMKEFFEKEGVQAALDAEGKNFQVIKDGRCVFEINFGVSRFEARDGMDPMALDREKVLSVVRAGQAIAIESSGLFSEGESPFIYDPAKFAQVIEKWTELAMSLMSSEAFVNYDYKDKKYRVLQDDVSKVLRKQLAWSKIQAGGYEDFLARVRDEKQYKKLQEYYSLVGIVDFIKQWQLDFKEATLRSRQTQKMIKELQSFLKDNPEDRTFELKKEISPVSKRTLMSLFSEAQDLIERNPKSPTAQELQFPVIDSEPIFFAKASHLEEPVLISGDIVNMGGQNIKAFEVMMQQLNVALTGSNRGEGQVNEEEMHKLLMTAADDITRDFQSAVKAAMDLLEERGIKVSALKMGGDEFIMAINGFDQVTPELLLAIKHAMEEKVNVRIAASKAIKIARDNFKSKDGKERISIFIDDQVIFNPEAVRWFSLMWVLTRRGVEAGIDKLKELEAQGRGEAVLMQDNNKYGTWREYSPAKDGKGLTEVIYFPSKTSSDDAQAQDINGGIDFNPGFLNLQKQGQSANFDWPTYDGNWDNIQINGLVPVIINIQPIGDIPRFLGVKQEDKARAAV